VAETKNGTANGGRGMGRGLAAILSSSTREEAGLREIPTELISPNPSQPRRDFDDEALDRHVEYLRSLAEEVAAAEPRCAIEVESRIQYRNMRGALEQRPEIVANLEEAVRRAGLEPKQTSIRGGTDGSSLTEMGLPTPNIFTGGHDAHSPREWICVEDMGLAAATIVALAQVWAEGGIVSS